MSLKQLIDKMPAMTPPPEATSEPGCGERPILLSVNFETAPWPAEFAGVAADWVTDVYVGGVWYRPASPEYVAWLVARAHTKTAFSNGQGGPSDIETLRANFRQAALRMPVIELWAKHPYAAPGYRPPGQPPAECGPPYPARYYGLEDLSRADIEFLGRQNPEIRGRFPNIFPTPERRPTAARRRK